MKVINPTFQINERVRYSHAFLKSICADYDTSILTGIVKQIVEYPKIKKTVVKVLWNGDSEISSCLSSNLAHLNYDITE